jgi:hypothetical protein
VANATWDRTAKRAENELRSRAWNDRLAQAGQELGLSADAPLEFFCECADAHCITSITLSHAAFATIRDAGEFAMLPGHDDDRLDELVSERPDYITARKRR